MKLKRFVFDLLCFVDRQDMTAFELSLANELVDRGYAVWIEHELHLA